ncbi:MAG: hypothetical protein ABSD62_03795 [Candidatus Limnocylindrales bacterium]|jgi:hypothetical protein
MLGGASRDARRTERYLDGLMEAEERGAAEAPMDLDLDPAVLFAARELRAGLIRVHPSFRFEEGLAARLGQIGGGTQDGRGEQPAPVRAPASVAPFRTPGVAAPATPAVPAGHSAARDGLATPAAPRRLSLAARPSRPLVVGGVGVASAAISIGAVYVAWRWSRASQTPMVRAVRAARSGRAYASGHGRRAGVLHGILGVMS